MADISIEVHDRNDQNIPMQVIINTAISATIDLANMSNMDVQDAMRWWRN